MNDSGSASRQSAGSGSGIGSLQSASSLHARKTSAPGGAAPTWLAAALILPSLGALRRGGPAALLIYAIAVVLSLVVLRRLRPWLAHHLGQDRATTLFALGLGLLTLVFILVHPVLDEAGLPVIGLGPADGDDAYELSLDALLAGMHPYGPLTFLGNPITPMPGALLLALPFHLLGNASLQNLFWLGALFWLLERRHGDSVLALLVVAAPVLLSPAFGLRVLTGNDYLTNGIWLLVGMVWLDGALRADRPWAARGAAVFLGIALASRPTFALLGPLLLAQAARLGGAGLAVRLAGLCLLTAALLVGPLWAWDPAAFSPLHNASKLRPGDGPGWLGLLGPLAAGVLAVVLALRPGARRVEDWAARAFAVQGVLFLGTAASAMLQLGWDGLVYLNYLVLPAAFGLFAFGPAAFSPPGAGSGTARAGTR